LQKTHFWSDYYNGQLSSYGLHTLNSLCDQAIDTPKKFVDLKTIKAHILGKSRLRSLLNTTRRCTHRWQSYLPGYRSTKIGLLFFLLILVECLLISYQLRTNLCYERSHGRLRLASAFVSIVLFLADTIQLYTWSRYGHQEATSRRWIRFWILLYGLATLSRLLSSIVYVIILLGTSSTELCIGLYVLQGLSALEYLLLCISLISPLRVLVDYMLNRYISVSYDIGLAYISSEEQVLNTIHRLTDNGESVS
jgi:hypothetical protein